MGYELMMIVDGISNIVGKISSSNRQSSVRIFGENFNGNILENFTYVFSFFLKISKIFEFLFSLMIRRKYPNDPQNGF